MSKVKQTTTERKKTRPMLTPEARENQIISYAMDLVEERILNGTASSQETTHFLKLGSMKNQLEMKKLERENILLEAKTEALKSQKKQEELFEEAIKAMKSYSGNGNEDDYDY